MSDSTDSDKPGQLDLTSLRLMPDWVAEIGKEAPTQKFRDYGEREERGGRRDDQRRDGGRGPGGHPSGGRDDRGGKFGRDGFGGKGKGGHGPRDDRREGGRDFEPREPVPTDITVSVEAEEKAADALATHIRHTGRAFSMFDASRLVLGSGDRFHVRFTCAPERPSGLFRVAADGALFLSREDAARYVLNSSALAEYYRTEEIELEEPKGEFKSVGVCGYSGALIGPPSHHSYQTSIIRLHRERFSNMSLEDYKRRIRVESDPELVAKWKEQQRKGTRWVYLKGQVAEGEEPLALNTRAEMESLFRRTHSEDAVTEVREALVPGSGPKEKLARVLIILLQRAVENARNHLFDFSQHLGHALEHRGLKLFKRRSGKLFVSRIRPHAIDPGVVFSARITAIVETIKERPGILISKLAEAVAAGEPAAENMTADPAVVTDAQLGVMKDLRWLADEGFVIEYSDGAVFLGVQGEAQPAVKPAPKNPSAGDRKREAKPVATPAAAAVATVAPAATEPEASPVEEESAPAAEQPSAAEEQAEALTVEAASSSAKSGDEPPADENTSVPAVEEAVP